MKSPPEALHLTFQIDLVTLKQIQGCVFLNPRILYRHRGTVLGHILQLNTTRKAYMRSKTAQLDLTLSDREMLNVKGHRF